MKIFNSNRDGGSSSAFYEQDDGKKRKKPHPYVNLVPKPEPSTIVVTDEAVNAAINSFKSDDQSITQGLEVEKQGSGPGLKIVLRDGAGSIIRNLSGEEFLKLREAATDGCVSGKILDQKA